MKYDTEPYKSEETEILFKDRVILNLKSTSQSTQICKYLNDAYMNGANDMADCAKKSAIEIRNEIEEDVESLMSHLIGELDDE